MTLRCFIAMAFEYEDTDKVYDDLIAPTLRGKGITPIRVDHIEHTDDIDDRIIAELKRCDFILADLTYARPSVYYEAGFAERNVSAIYICRRDHLSANPDDEFGNLRVHFDLQMKNIIPWSSHSDTRFARRLATRINLIITPLIRAKETEQKEKQEANKFAAFSLRKKTNRILNICILKLKRFGCHETTVRHSYTRRRPDGYFYTPPIIIESHEAIVPLSLQPGWLGTKYVDGAIRTAFVHVTPSLTRIQLTTLYKNLLQDPIYDLNPGSKNGPLKRISEHLFICSFRRVPTERVMHSLPDFKLGREHNSFIWTGTQKIPNVKMPGYRFYFQPSLEGDFFAAPRNMRTPERRQIKSYSINDKQLIGPGETRAGSVRTIPRQVYIHLFDTIRFEKDFEVIFSDVLKRV